MARYRVFISSPGDVGDERRTALRVLARLQGRYAAALTIEPIVWEHDPVRATATFQDQITPPAECDLVVCILWSRLGTRLPADYRRPDGTVYDSGTAYEFETATVAYRKSGRPDLLVYRKTAPPIVDVRDRRGREQAAAEWDRLTAYLDGWFRNDDGSFRAAYTAFERTDQFEEQLEQHVDGLLQDRLEEVGQVHDAAPASPVWLRGSPFRGLEVFDVEHEHIFHGRSRAVGQVIDRLNRRALAGTAFVLVHGMSGSGKSSLVRAGVIPAITDPGVVEGVGLWRHAILTPSRGETPLRNLLDALSEHPALPELREGDYSTDDLTTLVSESPDRIESPVRRALDRAASRLQETERLTTPPDARVAVVIDQLEELFTDERINRSEREAFVSVLAALARSGLVWVIATMRSDFYHRCAEIPALVELKDGLGSYELMPPSGAEIAQMIRNPARSAGLTFEVRDDRGQLDDVILEAASRSVGTLPLLEFTLDALYRARTGQVLTFAAYDELGGLDGAIARRAERELDKLPGNVQTALESVLLSLVTIQRAEGRATARSTRKAVVCSSADEEKLVAAFVAARLLVADGEGDEAVLRVAHEAVLNNWPRAQAIIDGNRSDLLARDRVQANADLWLSKNRDPGFLLPPGKRLEEAIGLPGRMRDELDGLTIEFIDASTDAERRQRRRSRSRTVAAFAALMVLLGLTAWQWRSAVKQSSLALSRQLATASSEALDGDDVQLSLLLAVEAFRRAETDEAANVLRAGLEASALLERTIWLPPGGVRKVAFSPDGRQLAAYHAAGRDSARLARLDLETGATMSSLMLDQRLDGLAWGDRLVGAVVSGNTVNLLRFEDDGSRERVRLPESCRQLHDLGADGDGTMTVSCYSSVLRAQQGRDGWTVAPLDVLERGGYMAALSGDGRHGLTRFDRPAVWHDGVDGLHPLELQSMSGADVDLQTYNLSVDHLGRRIAVEEAGDMLVWAIDGPSTPLAAVPVNGTLEDQALSPDGRQLALAFRDGRVEVWTVGAVEPLVDFAHLCCEVLEAVALSSDRNHVALASNSGLVYLYRLADDGSAPHLLSGWPGPLSAAVVRPPDSGGSLADRSVVVAHEAPHRLVARLASQGDSIGGAEFRYSEDDAREQLVGLAVAATPDGRLLAAVDEGRFGIRITNLLTGISSDTFDLGSSASNAASAFSMSGQYLIHASGSGVMRRFDLEQHTMEQVTRSVERFGSGDRFEVAAADNGSMVVGFAGQVSEKPLLVWDPDSDSPTTLWTGDVRYDQLHAADISPAGDRIAAAVSLTGSDRILLWYREGTAWRADTLNAYAETIAFSPDGHSLAAQGDGVSVLELATGEIHELQGAPATGGNTLAPEVKLAWDPAGQSLLAMAERDVRIWNVQTGEAIGSYDNVLAGGMETLAFIENNQILAAVSARGTAVWWSLGDSPERVSVEENSGLAPSLTCVDRDAEGLAAVALSPGVPVELCTSMPDENGVPLHTGVLGDWAVLWEVPTGDPVQRACRAAGRNLTENEWDEHVGESIRYRKTCS